MLIRDSWKIVTMKEMCFRSWIARICICQWWIFGLCEKCGRCILYGRMATFRLLVARPKQLISNVYVVIVNVAHFESEQTHARKNFIVEWMNIEKRKCIFIGYIRCGIVILDSTHRHICNGPFNETNQKKCNCIACNYYHDSFMFKACGFGKGFNEIRLKCECAQWCVHRGDRKSFVPIVHCECVMLNSEQNGKKCYPPEMMACVEAPLYE